MQWPCGRNRLFFRQPSLHGCTNTWQTWKRVLEPEGDLQKRGDGDYKAFASLRMVTDYRAVNDAIELAAMPMLNL